MTGVHPYKEPGVMPCKCCDCCGATCGECKCHRSKKPLVPKAPRAPLPQWVGPGLSLAVVPVLTGIIADHCHGPSTIAGVILSAIILAGLAIFRLVGEE